MITTTKNSSRRNFLEKIAIASTVLAVSPSALMGKDHKKMLQFAVLGTDSTLSTVIANSDEMSITKDYKIADIVYSKNCDKQTLKKALLTQKYLIIEQSEHNEWMIQKCQELGLLLAIVERSENEEKLFSKTDFYESKLNKSFDIQNIIKKLDFLVRNTQNGKVNIFSI